MSELQSNETENLIRNFLEGMFGVHLRKRKLVVGYDSKNRPQIHEFDVVSDDMNIVGEIKSGRKSRGNFVGALSDCFLLTKVKAKKKLLVLSDKEFYGHFKANAEGIIPNDIDVMLINPEDLASKIMVSN